MREWIETDAGGDAGVEWLDVSVDGEIVASILARDEYTKVRVYDPDGADVPDSLASYQFDRSEEVEDR